MIKHFQFALFWRCWSFGLYIWFKPVLVFTLAIGPLYFGIGSARQTIQVWTMTWEKNEWKKKPEIIKGFTLIELLCCLGIIGLLTVIAIANYAPVIDKFRELW